jgi:hypothetical protein
MDEAPARGFSHARFLIFTGAAVTLLLALNGVRLAIGRVSPRNASELVVIIPLWVLVGLWMLSPYWGALRLQRLRATTRLEDVVVVAAAWAITLLGANSFLVTSTFVGGKPHPTADGVTVMFIPIVQWLVVVAAYVLLRVRQSARRR